MSGFMTAEVLLDRRDVALGPDCAQHGQCRYLKYGCLPQVADISSGLRPADCTPKKQF